MLAVNYSTIRGKFKDYCDKVSDEQETVIVTRKGERNVVILSLEEYNAIMKAARNAAYLEKINQAIAQIENGEIVRKTMNELENMSDE